MTSGSSMRAGSRLHARLQYGPNRDCIIDPRVLALHYGNGKLLRPIP